ncbi:MAG: ABC transporter permease [Acidobacteria bacterium]|nr:ABC transporter permease [Acidobacteriota bacterium]
MAPRHPVRPAPAAQEPSLHRHRRPVAGHRDRREYDDRLGRECDAAAAHARADATGPPGRHRQVQSRGNLRYRLVSELRRRPRPRDSFTGIYAHEIEPTPMSLGGDGGAERTYGSVVTANYFTVLGTVPHLGRLLRPEDDSAIGAHPVAALSFDLWTRRFAADPAIAGRQVTINGAPFAVVGVGRRDSREPPSRGISGYWSRCSSRPCRAGTRPFSRHDARPGCSWVDA